MKCNFTTRLAKQEGFTLLEVLVALALIAVTFLAISRALVLYLQSSESWQNLATATVLAQNKLSEIEMQENLTPGTTDGNFPEFPKFRWIARISGIDMHRLNTLRKVEITIVWQEEGEANEFQMETLLTQSVGGL
ncbi:MAG: prepilin-type N-terminal cleavage/methylation domain-containing protein [bacterium]